MSIWEWFGVFGVFAMGFVTCLCVVALRPSLLIAWEIITKEQMDKLRKEQHQ